MIDPAGKVQHFRYDSQGYLTGTYDALGVETDMDHNLSGQPGHIFLPATAQNGVSVILYVFLYDGGVKRLGKLVLRHSWCMV